MGFSEAYDVGIVDHGSMIVVHMATGVDPGLDRFGELSNRGVPGGSSPAVGSHSRRPVMGQQHV